MIALLFACALDIRALDLDDDGFYRDDCDDGRSDVHPGAEEACDGVDNDCDGGVDVGACGRQSALSDADVTIHNGETPMLAGVGGRFDGDGFGDALLSVSLAGSPAVCVLPGARLLNGGDGSLLATPEIEDVSTCWVVSGQVLGVAVSSAAAFGQPQSDVGWVLSSGDGLCAVDPFGAGLTLGEGAYGCASLDAWGPWQDVPSITGFGVASQTEARLFAVTRAGVAVASTALYPDASALWVLSTVDAPRAVAGGEDLDGDGVEDIVIVDALDAWVVSSDFGISAPVEVALSLRLPIDDGSPGGVAVGGDVNGDGYADWVLQMGDEVRVMSRVDEVGRVFGQFGSTKILRDFNGDGLADVAVSAGYGGESSVFLDVGGANYASDAEFRVFADAQGFGAATFESDVANDGFSDLWVMDPVGDDVTAAGLYLFAGFPIDLEP